MLGDNREGAANMGRMDYVAGFTEDREQVVFEVREDGKALAHLLLDGAETEHLIRNLGRIRRQLREQVAPQLDPGARLEYIEHPAWLVPSSHGGSGTLIALRHPELGWLAFTFPREVAKSIGEALIKFSNEGV